MGLCLQVFKHKCAVTQRMPPEQYHPDGLPVELFVPPVSNIVIFLCRSVEPH